MKPIKIIKIPSRSIKEFRRVSVIDNIDGSTTFKCSCPANSWWWITNGRYGKEFCHHIKMAKKLLS